ncbi:ash family protein [Candidatus Symbiopectobacterium sp. NZEC135]|nr:ash family protein [Candidatus Symbiopectobacterium sp. NZEC135]MCW2480247.1 ash family protein [Candidatus Symbiopectobacterium sp. NZEC135]
MVARAGLPKGRPVSRLSGNANPVRATTLEIGVSGGS